MKSRGVERKKGQQGITLMEIVVTTLIASIFMGMLFSFMQVSSQQVARMQATKEVEMMYERIRQFILEEVEDSAVVCMRIYPENVLDINAAVDMCHEVHNKNSVDYKQYLGAEKPLAAIHFDRDKRNVEDKLIERRLQVGYPNVEDGMGLLMLYQGNPLTHEREETGVCRLMAANLLTDGKQYYIKLVLKDPLGRPYEGQFQVPIAYKGEGYVPL